MSNHKRTGARVMLASPIIVVEAVDPPEIWRQWPRPTRPVALPEWPESLEKDQLSFLQDRPVVVQAGEYAGVRL